jgi:hypothetical protein
MNNARDAAMFVHPSPHGKMNFTKTRQDAERDLGRTKFLKWQADESDEEEEEETTSAWPWEMNAVDKELMASAKFTALKMWESPSSGFRIPKRMFSRLGHLKIHDWMAMCGSVFAYFLAQVKGIAADHMSLLVDYTYALVSEPTYPCHLIKTRHAGDHDPQEVQEDAAAQPRDQDPRVPGRPRDNVPGVLLGASDPPTVRLLYSPGTLHAPLGNCSDNATQVRLGGPMFAHGMLEVRYSTSII